MELVKTVKSIKRSGEQTVFVVNYQKSSVEKPSFSEGSNFDGIGATKTERTEVLLWEAATMRCMPS